MDAADRQTRCDALPGAFEAALGQQHSVAATSAWLQGSGMTRTVCHTAAGNFDSHWNIHSGLTINSNWHHQQAHGLGHGSNALPAGELQQSDAHQARAHEQSSESSCRMRSAPLPCNRMSAAVATGYGVNCSTLAHTILKLLSADAHLLNFFADSLPPLCYTTNAPACAQGSLVILTISFQAAQAVSLLRGSGADRDRQGAHCRAATLEGTASPNDAPVQVCTACEATCAASAAAQTRNFSTQHSRLMRQLQRSNWQSFSQLATNASTLGVGHTTAGQGTAAAQTDNAKVQCISVVAAIQPRAVECNACRSMHSSASGRSAEETMHAASSAVLLAVQPCSAHVAEALQLLRRHKFTKVEGACSKPFDQCGATQLDHACSRVQACMTRQVKRLLYVPDSMMRKAHRVSNVNVVRGLPSLSEVKHPCLPVVLVRESSTASSDSDAELSEESC